VASVRPQGKKGREDDSSLGNVRVPIRVILLKTAPDGFSDDLTRTSNLQNRVEPRDLDAQDPEQKRSSSGDCNRRYRLPVC
jgi:hypothetical protein